MYINRTPSKEPRVSVGRWLNYLSIVFMVVMVLPAAHAMESGPVQLAQSDSVESVIEGGKEFRIVRDIPYDDERVAYQIGVERGWAFIAMTGDLELKADELTLIGRYFAEKGDAVLPPEVRIRAARIEDPEAVQSLAWIRKHYKKFDVTIDQTNYESQFISDLDISFMAKEAEFSGRSMIKVVENRLFLVECVAETRMFKSIEENCAAAFRTFAVNTKENRILQKEKNSA